ncbi:MAG: MFS transporter [Deferrisomatales bacterium]|nr:MFS transporter [Deferrisomatales bacterium]
MTTPGGAVADGAPAGRPGPGWGVLVARLAVAVLGRLLLNTARRFPYPFAPVLQRGLGVSLPAVTSLIAVSQATSFLSPLFGPLGDRWGQRSLMLGGLWLLAAGMLGAGAIATYGAVLAGIFLAGLGKSIFDPAVQAYVGEQVPYRRRGFAIGLVELAWSGAALLGIPIVGLLIAAWGWRAPFLVLGALALVAALALARVLPRWGHRPGRSSPRGVWAGWGALLREPAACSALGFGFFLSAANDNLFVVYGVWLEGSFGLGVAALGAATVAIGAAEVGGELLTALASDRMGLRRAVLGGTAVAAVGYALLPLSGASLPASLGGLFLVFLVYEFAIVTSFSLMTEVLPRARATMLSAYVAALGAGRLVGALAGGPVWLAGGLPLTGLVSAGLTAAAWVCLARGMRGWAPAGAAGDPLPPME